MAVRDVYQRPLRNLRISVTDRCNLRCSYCMPEEDYVWLPREQILNFEEMSTLVDVFMDLGVDKIRLTGGEPLLRRDLPELVRLLADKPKLRDLAMTTNGVLLARARACAARGRAPSCHGEPRYPSARTLHRAHAPGESRAGARGDRRAGAGRLHRDEARHGRHAGRQRRRAGRADRVRPGRAGRGALHRVHGRRRRDTLVDGQGREPHRDADDPGARDTGGSSRWSRTVPAPADRYRLADGTVFGIISSTTEPFCASCDRSRLTADGVCLSMPLRRSRASTSAGRSAAAPRVTSSAR